MGDYSQHFAAAEFACPCCGELPPDGMDGRLIEILEMIRAGMGDYPVIISSGYRCHSHNAAVGGVPQSYHLYGRAADIYIPSNNDILKMAYLAECDGAGGIGLYFEMGFVHVDTRDGAARWCG